MTITQKRRIAMKALDKAIKRLKRMKKHSLRSPEYGKLLDEYRYYKRIFYLYDHAFYVPGNQQNGV